MKIITEKIKNEIKSDINKVLKNEKNIFEIDFCNPNLIIETIKELGFNIENIEMDSNGWEYDFWIYITVNNINFCIGGSGYYGSTYLEKTDE